MKTCTICKAEKTIEEFNRRTIRGHYSFCKSCGKDSKKRYRNSRKGQQWRIIHKYEITLEQWEGIKKSQDYKCKICKMTKTLVIDHDHHSGKVRGALCRQCNSAIGLLGDSILRITNALSYISNEGQQKYISCLLSNPNTTETAKRGDGIFSRNGALYISWTNENGKRLKRRSYGDTIEMARWDRAEQVRKVKLLRIAAINGKH